MRTEGAEIRMDREDLTKAMRWYVADRLAEDRLPIVNQKAAQVHPKVSFYSKYVKRFLDILISGFMLLVTLPINLLLLAGTFLDVGRPIFFTQERLGKGGKLFRIVKFRNMRDTRDEKGELLPPKQRVTKFGRFVRKTSLDELLNFWSILKGDMSVIGPRPLVPEYRTRFNSRHEKRLCVSPGLECPPRKALDHVWTWQEQLENDIWYVENVSFKTDVFLCFQLVRFAFDRKSANARTAAGRGTFMGYDLDGNAINLDGVPQEYIDECERFSETGVDSRQTAS